GAVVGGIAGATVGGGGIPAEWIRGLCEWPRSVAWMRKLAGRLADRFSPGGGAAGRGALPLLWPGLIPRNLLFLVIVFLDAFRRPSRAPEVGSTPHQSIMRAIRKAWPEAVRRPVGAWWPQALHLLDAGGRHPGVGGGMNPMKALTAAATVLVALASLVGAQAQQARITVHADQVLHPVSRYLTGACLEDVNHEVYGGLYSQMIFG